MFSTMFSSTEQTNADEAQSSVFSPSFTSSWTAHSSRSCESWDQFSAPMPISLPIFHLETMPYRGQLSFPTFLFTFPPSFHDSSKPNFLQKSFAFFPQVLLTRLVHISIFDCCFNRTRSVPPVAKENPTVVAPAEPDPEDAAATTSLLVRRYYYATAATTTPLLLLLRRCCYYYAAVTTPLLL